MRAARKLLEMDGQVSYDETNERVQQIADEFRTHSALVGCAMFFVIAMLIDQALAAWPAPRAVLLAATPWAMLLGVLCYLFEELRRRAAARLASLLRGWYARGPGARGARLIDDAPLSITYEHLGRTRRAAIDFLWSRIAFDVGPVREPDAAVSR